jgi:3-oxoacyl-[acyl-carrier protein] reductase
MSSDTFKDKVAIVTGSSMGIGKAAALLFARGGASLVVNCRSSEAEARAVCAEIERLGQKSLFVKGDVSMAETVNRMVKQTLGAFGRIDILVNNAGSMVKRASLQEMDEALWDEVIRINLKSAFLCTKAVLPQMIKQNYGKIVNLSSLAARVGGAVGSAHYATAKLGLHALTMGTAKEAARCGVTVNAVLPGAIQTPFADNFTSPEMLEKFKSLIPMGRIGTAEEVADVIAFFASEQSRYVTGQTLDVNGGWLMY